MAETIDWPTACHAGPQAATRHIRQLRECAWLLLALAASLEADEPADHELDAILRQLVELAVASQEMSGG